MPLVKNLNFRYKNMDINALNNFSFRIVDGKINALIGETASGKTTFAKYLMRVLPVNDNNLKRDLNICSSNMIFYSKENVGYISQNCANSLSEYYTIGQQFHMLLKSNGIKNKKARNKKIKDILKGKLFNNGELSSHNEKSVNLLSKFTSWLLGGVNDVLNKYPFEISGGELQRIQLSMAMSKKTLNLLVADEPTSAIDPKNWKKIIQVLKEINEKGVSVLLISHNISFIEQIADYYGVIYEGTLLEYGKIINNTIEAKHPYTELLKKSTNYLKGNDLAEKIENLTTDKSCPFAKYCLFLNNNKNCKHVSEYDFNDEEFSACRRNSGKI